MQLVNSYFLYEEEEVTGQADTFRLQISYPLGSPLPRKQSNSLGRLFPPADTSKQTRFTFVCLDLECLLVKEEDTDGPQHLVAVGYFFLSRSTVPSFFFPMKKKGRNIG